MNKKLIYMFCIIACTSLVAHESMQLDTNTTKALAPDYTYDMNFTALFLKPSSNLIYAAQATPLPIESPVWNIYSINPSYNFAFDLGAQVTFHDKNSLIKGNWEHFLSSDSASHNAYKSTDMVGPLSDIGPDASIYKTISGLASYQRDKMNICYSQSVQVGHDLEMNLFAGISFNRLNQSLIQTYSSNNTPDTITTFRSINTTNSFSGIGPEVGIDLLYRLHKGLKFISRTSIDLATGTTKNHVAFSSYSPLNNDGPIATANPNEQSTTVDGQLIIVPIFTQKIGVNYELKFRDTNAFQIEIGYLTQFYTNVFHTLEFATDVPLDTTPAQVGVFAQSFQEKITNFGLSGPYFRAEIAF
jgi:hypothetical protein